MKRHETQKTSVSQRLYRFAATDRLLRRCMPTLAAIFRRDFNPRRQLLKGPVYPLDHSGRDRAGVPCLFKAYTAPRGQIQTTDYTEVAPAVERSIGVGGVWVKDTL